MKTINLLAVPNAAEPGCITTHWLSDYTIEGSCSIDKYTNYVFDDCTFGGTTSRGSIYTKCRFSHCTFDNAGLYWCEFSNCIFDQCKFMSVNSKDSRFEQCRFSLCHFIRGAIHNAKGELATIEYCVFEALSIQSTDLHRCRINGTKFNCVDFSKSRATSTNFDGSVFEAPLGDTYLATSDIANAELLPCDRPRRGIILTEPIVGYKKTYEDLILKALIPAGSIVFSINGGKCRTNRAIILDTCGRPMLHSQYDHGFRYVQGQEVIIPDFDLDYRNDCSTGFHFFKSRKEAEEY